MLKTGIDKGLRGEERELFKWELEVQDVGNRDRQGLKGEEHESFKCELKVQVVGKPGSTRTQEKNINFSSGKQKYKVLKTGVDRGSAESLTHDYSKLDSVTPWISHPLK